MHKKLQKGVNGCLQQRLYMYYMSDDLLLETYNKALEFNLSYDFIVLLLAEIERRSLQVKEAVLTP